MYRVTYLLQNGDVEKNAIFLLNYAYKVCIFITFAIITIFGISYALINKLLNFNVFTE